MGKTFASWALIAALAANTAAQAQDEGPAAEDVCKAKEEALSQLQEKYKPEQESLAAEGRQIEENAPKGLVISGEIEFDDEHIALDVPQVTMVTRKISFDLPRVTMAQRKVSFDIVETRMETREIGRKPEVTCHWSGWKPECTTEWTGIYADFPVIEKTTKEFSTDIPEVTMTRVDASFDLPQVKMARQDLYLKVPRIKAKSPIPDTGPTEAAGKRLEERAGLLANRINADATEATGALYACHADQLAGERDKIAKGFDDALAELDSSIKTVRDIGADPTRLGTDAGKIDLVKQREDLVKERDGALAKIDLALKQLGTTAERGIEEASPDAGAG